MRVVRRINRGGFGYVDEVIDDNGNHVARKTFDPQLVGQAVDLISLRRQFEREVRIQSAIKHPNIMPILKAKLEWTLEIHLDKLIFLRWDICCTTLLS
jgi:eukaryotic-like serine/threonine-protein kinase